MADAREKRETERGNVDRWATVEDVMGERKRREAIRSTSSKVGD